MEENTDTLIEQSIGKIFSTRFNGDCKVLRQVSNGVVEIQFLDTGFIKTCQLGKLKKGLVKDLYRKSVYGVGYVGGGSYKCNQNNRCTKEYDTWTRMLDRCYNKRNTLYHRYGGRGVTVCEEWHNFQNFAQWCNEQPNFGKEDYHLDKDIMGGKDYSPFTCKFIPSNLNRLLLTSNRTRGEYPVGVTYHKKINKYAARCCVGEGKRIHIGTYLTVTEAFAAYKDYKESYIKQVANKYKSEGIIDEDTFQALINWKVVPFPE